MRIAIGTLALLLAVLAASLYAQENYRTLWRRGEYAKALQMVERGFADPDLMPPMAQRDYAELLFAVGKADEAIEILSGISGRYISPMTSVRLAEMYRYCGRREELRQTIRYIEREVEMLREYRRHAEDMLAAGRAMELKGEDPKEVLRQYAQVEEAFPDFVQAPIAAGNLALRKRTYDLAARKYGRALELEPEEPEALAGLARCYAASGDSRVRETLERLEAVNPSHPVIFLLKVERLLDLGAPEAAVASLDSVLAVNPNHLEALSLKAAARFLQDDSTAMAAVQEKALAFNPYASEAYRIPGRVASRHYRFEAGLVFQEQALEVDPEDVEARLLLAFDLLRLGEDQKARRELERVFKADPYSVRAYNLLEAADAIDAFRTVERDIFKLQMPDLEAGVFSGAAAELLSGAAAQYQEKYRMTLETPVVVQVFDDHDVFMVRSVGLPGSAGHLGICFGRLVTMDSPRARAPGSMSWRQVLWHEFVHVITLQKTGNRIPRWLSEGISVYEETEADPAWGQRLAPEFKAVVDAEGYPDASDLQRFFTTPPSPTHLMFGYFAAGAFVKWYVERYGAEALVAALEKIGTGAEALGALGDAAGDRGLDERFRTYMAKRFAVLAQLEKGSAFRRALEEGGRAAGAGNLEGAEKAYLEAYGLYPDYAGADAPLRRIVRLYEGGEDADRYGAALERVAAWDPTAYEACVKLGRLRAEAGDWAGAAQALDRAFGIYPFYAPLYQDRAQVRMAAADWDGARRDLERLMELDAPGRTRYRVDLARVLFQKGDREGARTEVLDLLEALPHFWEAQKLLLEIAEAE